MSLEIGGRGEKSEMSEVSVLVFLDEPWLGPATEHFLLGAIGRQMSAGPIDCGGGQIVDGASKML